MGIREHFTGTPVHRECRHCGENLAPDDGACPVCGGGVAVYRL